MAVNSLGVCVNEKLITALLAILLALGGWTLQRTFSLSQDMVLIKVKVETIEKQMNTKQNLKNKKKRKKKKQKVN
jgi:sensor domain CHASE-containing protein